MKPWETAAEYHRQTEHHFHRSARSLGFMDWRNQPDPFRRYSGAPLIPLTLTRSHDGPSYDDVFDHARVAPRPVCENAIAAFMQFSLSLSAWKEYRESRWALRINPSSGNLHPTEGYLVTGAVGGLCGSPALWHYAPQEHAVERRAEIAEESWRALVRDFPAATFLAGLSSVHWREAWKYGERAYRYCQHDLGHALAAMSISAALLGWHALWLDGLSDAEVSNLLGLDREPDFQDAEREHPGAILAIIPQSPQTLGHLPTRMPEESIRRAAVGKWLGRANRLSADHVHWDIIDSVAEACTKPAESLADNTVTPLCAAVRPVIRPDSPPARRIINQRRSAVALDGETSVRADQFCAILDRVIPRPNRTPWNTFRGPVLVHLGLFVHRVKGLDPGLYMLVRSPDKLDELRGGTRPGFAWQVPHGVPDSLPLYRLMPGDLRLISAQLACGQDIAADGAFSCAMLAEFDRPLRTRGAWLYRRLHWETGAVGQVLYLEAEAAGVRATGIGCFFDAPTAELFGMDSDKYKSLYHFTVGGPVEDTRLTTMPPYPPQRYD